MKTIILAHDSISERIRELPVASEPLSLETLGCRGMEVQTAREVEGTLWGSWLPGYCQDSDGTC